jgi:hypothetical protein
MTELAIPPALRPFAGRITDVDTHEQMPAQCWVETFGEVARPIAEMLLSAKPTSPNHPNVPGYRGDDLPIERDDLWTRKGPTSPGAVDLPRRLAVMDMMAIDRQLMFPTSIGAWAQAMYGAPEGSGFHKRFGDQTHGYAERLFCAYNEWAAGLAGRWPRIRPVTPVFGTDPADLIKRTRTLLGRGVRAVSILSSRLPAGVSPAHPALDPFYAMLAEAEAPLTLHLAGELLFFRTTDWNKAPAFDGYKVTEETSLDPWRLSVMHLAPQNFVATMITGGVFHRHPRLRLGVLEYAAHWVAPLARMLDLWHDNDQSIGHKDWGANFVGDRLPLRPSEYLARNVRVSPYDFEPIDEYFELNRALDDVYCFASDYPHLEGGKDPMGKLAGRLERLGPGLIEKFFVTNGEWLLPAN